MGFTRKLLELFGYVPKEELEKAKKRWYQTDYKKRNLHAYIQTASFSFRDTMHYVGVDLGNRIRNDTLSSLSIENAELLSLVGSAFPDVLARDLEIMLSDTPVGTIREIRHTCIGDYGIDALLPLPAKYWTHFYWSLFETNNKEKSMKSVMEYKVFQEEAEKKSGYVSFKVLQG